MYPGFDEFEKLAQDASMVPISDEFLLDTCTPISIFLKFPEEEYSFLLESVEGGERWARYSYIGRNPYLVFKSHGDTITLQKNGDTTTFTGEPFFELKSLMSKYRGAKVKGLPRFCGGAVGYIGYDMVRHIENLPNAPKEDINLPESCLAFYDEIITFDHLKQRVIVTVNAHTEGDLKTCYESAVKRIGETRKLLTVQTMQKQGKKEGASSDDTKLESTFDKSEFVKAVEKAKGYIKNGDIFQVVLSQRLSMACNADTFDVYRMLRSLNPSPYLFYLKTPFAVVAGSSPELLVRVEDGRVETCPIAGTRPRGKDALEDEKLSQELLADEKEKAEHTMLVDLGRNDIGKVSKFGSVSVVNPMHIEKFSHVMHIVSGVKGELLHDKDCFDALGAVLPAGTLSGAPKVRAMEIIDELEPTKRGIYGGCIGYIGFDGNMDTCITIRTIVFHKGRAYIQAGAGIVADSVPEREYEETLNKAKALLVALRKAGDRE